MAGWSEVILGDSLRLGSAFGLACFFPLHQITLLLPLSFFGRDHFPLRGRTPFCNVSFLQGLSGFLLTICTRLHHEKRGWCKWMPACWWWSEKIRWIRDLWIDWCRKVPRKHQPHSTHYRQLLAVVKAACSYSDFLPKLRGFHCLPFYLRSEFINLDGLFRAVPPQRGFG